MRRITWWLALASLLLLAACGGGGERDSAGGDGANEGDDGGTVATAAPAGETGGEETGGETGTGETGATGPTPGGPTLTPTPVMAPPVGVLGTPPATPEVVFEPDDPMLEQPPADAPIGPTSGFDYVWFQQTGGGDNIDIIIEIHADGRVVRDQRELPVPPAQIDALAAQIDEVDFFNMIATFTGPPPDENDYRYRLFVRRGSLERSIQAQDGFTPLPIQQLFGLIRRISDEALQAAGS